MSAPFFERADSLLGALWQDTHGSRHGSNPPFITLSTETGSGGTRLAVLLARRLNASAPTGTHWRIFEDHLVPEMLRRHQLPERLARFLPEDRIPETLAFLGEMVGLHPNIWNLVEKVTATTRDLAKEGHVILVNRAGQAATAGLAGGLHVRVVAPPEIRAAYTAEKYDMPYPIALEHNTKTDRARRRYAAAHFNLKIQDPMLYDLVLNTANVSLADATDMIAHRVGNPEQNRKPGALLPHALAT